eukprot:GEZU01025129.1.p2 GENE.GEZU01025129.1~~GEZU01025129.1.p2  ORF type:complete len:239 (-),score=63.39 GEZU01025129.1:1013-1729(-)
MGGNKNKREKTSNKDRGDSAKSSSSAHHHHHHPHQIPLKRSSSSSSFSSGGDHSDAYWKNAFGYIGLFGPAVDATAQQEEVTDRVPPSYIQNKDRRDGNGIHHITLMIKPEMKLAAENMRKLPDYAEYANKGGDVLLNIIADMIVDDWTDLGLGRVQSGNNEAYFKVIEWPSAAAFRALVGLEPKDFHVTVGFKSADIHGVNKGPSTLVAKTKKGTAAEAKPGPAEEEEEEEEEVVWW